MAKVLLVLIVAWNVSGFVAAESTLNVYGFGRQFWVAVVCWVAIFPTIIWLSRKGYLKP